MCRFPEDLREIQVVGPQTREWIVDLAQLGMPMWQRRIVACGVSHAGRGFRFETPGRANLSIVMVCSGGEGRALVGRRWRGFGEGSAYLMPAGLPYAYHHTGRDTWRLAWVCFVHIDRQEPVIGGEGARLLRVDPRPLGAVIGGLHRELIGSGDLSMLQHYLALVDAHARRIIGESATQRRLWRLWQQVDADPARPWMLADLAGLAGMSVETLRLVCQRETGRSPLGQVTVLRMRRAAALLASREVKVSAVASALGYRNPFAFSTAFKRHMGQSPAAFRLSGRQSPEPSPEAPDMAFIADAESGRVNTRLTRR